MEKNVLLRRFQRTDWTEGEQTCEFYRIFWSNPLLSIADLRSLLDQTNGAIDAFDGPITLDDVKELHTQIQAALDSVNPPHAQVTAIRSLLVELQAAIDEKTAETEPTTDTTAADAEQTTDNQAEEIDKVATLIAAIRAALDTLEAELYPAETEPTAENTDNV